jgi:hypothetical protein
MSQRPFDVQIDEIVVDSRLRMTRARIEQAIIEEVSRMLQHRDPGSLALDQEGGVFIDSLTLTASNAMSPVRLGESVASAISEPIGDHEHPARNLSPVYSPGDST